MAVPTLTSAAADYIATSIPDVGTVLPPKSGPSGSGWASTAVVDTSSGRSFFVKTAPRPAAAMFVAEAAGLRALAAAAAASGAEVVIPTAYAARDGDGGSFLVMDAVPMGGRVDMARLGDAVGAIHAAPPPPADVAGGTGYGFGVTAGTIGGSVQRNGWMDDWPAFWVERRLRPQLAATRDDALIREGAKLCDAVPAFFADVPAPAASCLHGDLWGGNYGATPEGVPVLFDPATYYGHAEVRAPCGGVGGGGVCGGLCGSMGTGEGWPATGLCAEDGVGSPSRVVRAQCRCRAPHLHAGGLSACAQGLVVVTFLWFPTAAAPCFLLLLDWLACWLAAPPLVSIVS